MELRLVANPRPFAAADELLSAVNELMDSVTATQDVFDKHLEQVGVEQRRFVDICRDDLWYLPQRWQFYRVGWWSMRWANWKRRRAE
ncbi:hypothetical protein [Actinacidiphila glaucinigra]|uniref:hypothetical protein n=1 Tax=Actinacidiphila glaucinigra TaxID=235986 RepID=UPI002E3569CC|nr:hypothetical protein [Actinacidiphila glaucinigra]